MIKLRINDTPCAFSEAGSEVNLESRRDAIIYLWALAKQDIPQFGIAWLPMSIEPMTNINMFSADPPESLRDEIMLIRKTLNESDIESLVCQGLNMVFDALSRYGDDPEFIEKVTESAKDWAIECYQPRMMEWDL